MKLHRVQAGVYLTDDGRFAVIREDYPSEDEYQETEYDPTWFVAAITEHRPIEDVGLPEGLFEATTKRACVEWLIGEYVKESLPTDRAGVEYVTEPTNTPHSAQIVAGLIKARNSFHARDEALRAARREDAAVRLALKRETERTTH